MLSMAMGLGSLLFGGCPAKENPRESLKQQQPLVQKSETKGPRPEEEPKNVLARERLPVFSGLTMDKALELFGKPDDTKGDDPAHILWLYSRQTGGGAEKLRIRMSGKRVYEAEWYAGVRASVKDTLPEPCLNLKPVRIIMSEEDKSDFVLCFYDKTRNLFPDDWWRKGVTVWIGCQATRADWRTKIFSAERGLYEWSIKDWKSANLCAYKEECGNTTQAIGVTDFLSEIEGTWIDRKF